MSDDPVKVPASAGGYSSATIDADLRNSINMALLRDGHVTKIQEHLLQSLQSNSSNWPTLIQTHALSLLRSGEATSFPSLLRRVLDDVRAANSPAALAAIVAGESVDEEDDTPGEDESTGTGAETVVANGNGNGNGNGVNGINGVNGTSNGVDERKLVLPQGVVVDALRVTRECMDHVVSVEDS